MNIGDVPTLDESDVFKWVANQAYCPRNLLAFVIRNGIPEAVADETIVADTVRCLLELHAQEISGLNTGFSHASPREKQVKFKFIEKYGRPIDSFLTWWYDKYQTAWNRGDVGDDGTLDVMFLEPDPTHTKVTHAIYMYRMRPIEYSGIESKRDLYTPRAFPVPEKPKPTFWQRFVASLKGDPIKDAIKKLQEAPSVKPTVLNVTFTGETSTGPMVIKFAQELLDQANVAATNPYVKPDPKVFGVLRRKAIDVYQF
jgi:hypothetical protein